MSSTTTHVEDKMKTGGMPREKASLHEHLAMMHQLVDTDPNGVYFRDLDGICRFANASFSRIIGVPVEQLIGLQIEQIFPQEVARTFLDQEETALAASMPQQKELSICLGQKERAYLLMHDLYYDTCGRVAGVFGRLQDCSEQRRIEREMVERSEREMQRVASDMHDDICQDLAAASLIARLLQKRLDDDHSAERKVAAHISELTKRISISARNLIQNIAPLHLSGECFVERLRHVAEELCSAFSIKCGIEGVWPKVLRDEMVALHLYRIVHEAMHNAAKHGGGNFITVRLRTSGDIFTVSISDNGRGFSPEDCKSGGIGLSTMHYRANMIGGVLRIQSAPGQGTTIACRLKLQ